MNGFECPACGAANQHEALAYIDPFWADTEIFKGLSIRYCRECGFGFSVPDIADEVVNAFYARSYRGPGSPEPTDFQELSRPSGADLRSLSQLLLARQFVDFRSGDCFVDIGPGGGASFASSATVFEKPDMYAIELSEGAAAAYQREYGAKTFARLEDLMDAGHRPRVILSSHSLEHFKLKDLSGLLATIRAALVPDGVFVVEVPHVDLRIHSEMRYCDSPHFLFFSREGLRKVLEHAGFTVLFLEACAMPYDDWWSSVNGQSSEPPRSLRGMLKSCLGILPKPVRYRLRQMRSVLNGGFRLRDFGSENFSYGGNRTCLRIVVRPNQVLP